MIDVHKQQPRHLSYKFYKIQVYEVVTVVISDTRLIPNLCDIYIIQPVLRVRIRFKRRFKRFHFSLPFQRNENPAKNLRKKILKYKNFFIY